MISNLSCALDAYSYLDLEVNTKEQIHSFGLLSPTQALNVPANRTSEIQRQLAHLQQTGGLLCGHNIRRFDHRHLTRQWAELNALLLIDTLELSVLAFPLEPTHKLQKDYKLSDYACNDPLEDSRATRLLLEQILQTLVQKPEGLRQLYVWLLTCGNEPADWAYRQLFQDLCWQVTVPPQLSALPKTAISEMNQVYLIRIWEPAPLGIISLSFEHRFTLAALLAWNHERHSTQISQAPSLWLNHLPDFQTVLNNLFPIPMEGFTYQPYLNEFGIERFRSPQEEAVQAIISGQNPLILMPTGGGKSLCYQLPALMYYRQQWRLTVCISPLQALMEDQVADLEALGLDFSTFINSTLSAPERSQRLEAIRNGQKGLLYISPEQLRSLSIRTLLKERLPVLWVIDEAHCITQWGHGFRPDYRYIPKFIQQLYTEQQRSLPRLALLTATATVKARQDICQLFSNHGLKTQLIAADNMSRQNLDYQVISNPKDKNQFIFEAVRNALNQGGCALVYTTTRKDAEKLAVLLEQQGLEAKHYHGKIDKEQKALILQAFKEGSLNVVTATCAFGMGINRKDVRAVIHNTLSSSLEAYIQEAGRAGRDGEPASCLLLFDGKDAETVFFLKSLNQLTITDLRNIFTAVRSSRRLQRQSEQVTEDWFWVTTEEIYQSSDLDEAFATEQDQRTTKIQVALYHLEQFGLLERAENLSTTIQYHLRQSNPKKSWQTFLEYAQGRDLPQVQLQQFEKLIYGMHLIQVQHQAEGERVSLERLSDESGIPVTELSERIRELRRAGVCSSQIPLTLLITKAVTGDARIAHERRCQLEQTLLEEFLALVGERQTLQVNLRGLATRLDPDGQQKLSSAILLDIVESWRALHWLKLKNLRSGTIEIQSIEPETGPLAKVIGGLENYQNFCRRLINAIYTEIDQKLEKTSGARLIVECEFEALLETICDHRTPTEFDAKQLKTAILWLHQRKILRLTEGLLLFNQALKIRVHKGANISTINRMYPEVQNHYSEQARQTHLMLEYGQLGENQAARQQLVEDYLRLSSEEFADHYPEHNTEAAKRPITQEDYDRIMGPLNPAQTAIVEAEDPAISVIAGPGSGKTRTIVHRIAYLIKVKRVNPDRILVLAYNRNAVRELRVRLKDLVGDLASRLRVYTFHGLALSLLGRAIGEMDTASQRQQSTEHRFQKLLEEACDLLAQGDNSVLADEDSQMRRVRLLGNTEYIFVDEYQDVAEQEYRLIQLIAGLDDSEDQARSVQINLCVIGDDDQNIYEFRGTNPRYILQFQAEYGARRFLLTENYRSTESIVQASNRLIQNNPNRCKREPQEQVRIDSARVGELGLPVQALRFSTSKEQAIWITTQVKQWIAAGMRPCEIAILAREWDDLKEVRAFLDRLANIPTHTLKGGEIKLVRNHVTQCLLHRLKLNPCLIIPPEQSVAERFEEYFERIQHRLDEPTVKALLKLAADLDYERGYGSDLADSISANEIITAIYEFSESPDLSVDEEAVLVTSCHGAKGLEFRKVILLTDKFYSGEQQLQQDRRLLYVAMTRAKEELILASTQDSHFLQEMQLKVIKKSVDKLSLPRFTYYADLSPFGERRGGQQRGNINLGCPATESNQAIIRRLRERDNLQMRSNRYRDGWIICTNQGEEIGALSRHANQILSQQGLHPNHFEFQPGEVTIRHIYKHLNIDEITGEIQKEWYIVVPQIRVCR
jgi:ATP-dependent DNA helicase RecQ